MTFVYHHSRNIPCLVTNLKLIPIGFPESVRRIAELTILLVYIIVCIIFHIMVVRVVEFLSGGYKIRKIFA